MIEAYPLHWPTGYPRTKNPERNRHFKQTYIGATRDAVLAELKRLGATEVIISSNIPLRADGIPLADFARRNIPDKGVAVYFDYNKQSTVLCFDAWDRWEDNFHAIAKTIEAIRGMERWGVSEMINRAFTGFKALPEKATGRPWWEVLDTIPNAHIDIIKGQYKGMAKRLHPDAPTGNKDAFIELNIAYQQALTARNAE